MSINDEILHIISQCFSLATLVQLKFQALVVSRMLNPAISQLDNIESHFHD